MNNNVMIGGIGAAKDNSKTHKALIKSFKSIKKVDSISEVFENDKSYFTVKYDVKDRFNYSRKDFNVDYDRKIVFVSNEGYFPYKNISELKRIVSSFLK